MRKRRSKLSQFAVTVAQRLIGFAGWLAGAANRLTRFARIKSYFRSHPTRKLHLGAGPHYIDGWLNTDVRVLWPPARFWKIVYLDVTKRFPFPDKSIDRVYSEHLIEHLSYHDGMAMVRECHRVLRPGGTLRIATPDVTVIMGLHTPEPTGLQSRVIKDSTDRCLPEIDTYRAVFVINNFFRRWGHQFLYDFELLRDAMEEAGFADVGLCPSGESTDPDLQGIEAHGEGAGSKELNDFVTMILEGKRPEQ